MLRNFLGLCLLAVWGLCGCSNSEVVEIISTPAPVILDGDFGSSHDDLIALDLLYKMQDRGEVELLAVMADREGIYNYGVIDLLNNWYGYPQTPIGIPTNAPQNPPIYKDYSKATYEWKDKNGSSFSRTYTFEHLSNLPSSVSLYRKLLSLQPNNSVIIFLMGFPCNLTGLLQSHGDTYSPLDGVELVTQKVKVLYLQAGIFSGGSREPDYNFKQDSENAKFFMIHWPTQKYFLPFEVGQDIKYENEDLLLDVKDHGYGPLTHIYTIDKIGTTQGQAMWDACAILQFSNPELFHLSPCGNVCFDDEFIATFTSMGRGCDFYQCLPSESEKRDILKHIRKEVSTKPKKK